MRIHFWLSGSTALAAALAATTASARTAVPASEQPAESAGFGEIVVTAQRRSERLQDIPLSVTAANAEDLARSRITDVSRMQFLTPGLTWGQQGADAFPAIRGVRTQLVSAPSDPVIGYYIDGVYRSRTQQQSFPFFDVERVEIQRGPQGTLYGRNTFGGNVSIITKGPSDKFEGGFNASAGNYDLRQIDAYVNLPLAEGYALRIAGYHSEHDGYVKSSTTNNLRINDENQSAVRVSFLAKPTPDLTIDLRGHYWNRDEFGGGAYGYKVVVTLIDPATGQR